MSRLATVLLVLAGSVAAAPPFSDFDPRLGYDPVAHPDQVYKFGCARFTFITQSIFRAEWDAKLEFEDRPTLAVINRKVIPIATVSITYDSLSQTLIIKNSDFILRYKSAAECDPSQPFNSDNFVIQSLPGRMAWTYRYGDNIYTDGGSHFGTIRSLDTVDRPTLYCPEWEGQTVLEEGLHCFHGVASSSGWSVVNDTGSYILPNRRGDWFNAETRSTSDIDIYFLPHNNNIPAAYRGLGLISGTPTPPPRASVGVMRSRWYNDNERDILGEITDGFATHGATLDFFIIDMNWHTKPQWGGYSWDLRLFPDGGRRMRAQLGRLSLPTMVNVHDDDGVVPGEAMYKEFCSAVRAPQCAANETVPFSPLSADYMRALDDVIGARGIGADHIWIDWQQGGKRGGLPDGALNPTYILNHARYTAPTRARAVHGDKRPFILARYGGIGSQRYPIGFSGDVRDVTWEALAYQPYFSTTAANALVAWSHDTVAPRDQPELYVRWLQMNAYSSSMRIHDRGMSAGDCADETKGGACGLVYPWQMAAPYERAARKALRERTALVPYLYDAWYQQAWWGMPILTARYASPYYENNHPAYARCNAQSTPDNACVYRLGRALRVAPIAAPMDGMFIKQTMILPPDADDYVDVTTGVAVTFINVTRWYTIDEVPVFAKTGTIVIADALPLSGLELIGRAARLPQVLELRPYVSGRASFAQTHIFEDDGVTTKYLDNVHMKSTFTIQFFAKRIEYYLYPTPGEGGVPTTLPLRRRYLYRFDFPLLMADNSSGSFSPYGCLGRSYGHTFDAPADAFCVYIDIQDLNTYVLTPMWGYSTQRGSLPVVVPEGATTTTMRNLRAVVRAVTTAKAALDTLRRTPGETSADETAFLEMASIPQQLAEGTMDAAAAYAAAQSRLYSATTSVTRTCAGSTAAACRLAVHAMTTASF